MCGYLKMNGLFPWSVDGTYTVLMFFFFFFFFFWDHQATERYDTGKYWPGGEDFIPWTCNVKDTLLLNLESWEGASASATHKSGDYEELCESFGQK